MNDYKSTFKEAPRPEKLDDIPVGTQIARINQLLDYLDNQGVDRVNAGLKEAERIAGLYLQKNPRISDRNLKMEAHPFFDSVHRRFDIRFEISFDIRFDIRFDLEDERHEQDIHVDLYYHGVTRVNRLLGHFWRELRNEYRLADVEDFQSEDHMNAWREAADDVSHVLEVLSATGEERKEWGGDEALYNPLIF
jgi:hypothetical protein